jgi:hypothetical protein
VGQGDPDDAAPHDPDPECPHAGSLRRPFTESAAANATIHYVPCELDGPAHGLLVAGVPGDELLQFARHQPADRRAPLGGHTIQSAAREE